MQKHKIFTILFFFCLISFYSNGYAAPPKSKTGSAKSKKSEKEIPPFEGVIGFYGKVTRIPDKSLTKAKLNDFENTFDLYINKEYTKTVDEFGGLRITTTDGLENDTYYQTIETKEEKLLITASIKEQQDFQLKPKYVKVKSSDISYQHSKTRKVKGYRCTRVTCNIVTEDNMRIQLVAWYTTEIHMPKYQLPFYGELPGIPLIYDMYNGLHVVTYTAQSVKKWSSLKNSYFLAPNTGFTKISYTDYVNTQGRMGDGPQMERVE